MKLLLSRHFSFGFLLASLILTGCASTPRPIDVPSANGNLPPNAEVARFHVGETVNILFSGTPDPILPHEEQIKEDGMITLPLIGSVKALGKTSGELQSEIRNLYVPNYYVRLNVTVKAGGELVFYVRGEVRNPGPQRYLGETSVTKAITSAGDFTDFSSHNVKLIRANGQVINVSVDKALEDSTLDPKVYPGDQITVGRRIF